VAAPRTGGADGYAIGIDVKLPPSNDDELRVMGAGAIAPVRTVAETLAP
jgi:hypothetical protein